MSGRSMVNRPDRCTVLEANIMRFSEKARGFHLFIATKTLYLFIICLSAENHTANLRLGGKVSSRRQHPILDAIPYLS